MAKRHPTMLPKKKPGEEQEEDEEEDEDSAEVFPWVICIDCTHFSVIPSYSSWGGIKLQLSKPSCSEPTFSIFFILIHPDVRWKAAKNLAENGSNRVQMSPGTAQIDFGMERIPIHLCSF